MKCDKRAQPGTPQAEAELRRRWNVYEGQEEAFGRNIKVWRKQRGWSQRQLVNALSYEGFDIHQTTLAKIEAGKRPLRISEFLVICNTLRVRMEWKLTVLP